MVAFSYRRTPAVVAGSRAHRQGALGRIRNFRGTYLQDWSNDPDLPLSWRFQRDVAGSGALGDIASHVLDIARYLVGDVSGGQCAACAPTSMTARSPRDRTSSPAPASSRRRAAEPVDVDDEVLTLLRFEDGAVGIAGGQPPRPRAQELPHLRGPRRRWLAAL